MHHLPTEILEKQHGLTMEGRGKRSYHHRAMHRPEFATLELFSSTDAMPPMTEINQNESSDGRVDRLPQRSEGKYVLQAQHRTNDYVQWPQVCNEDLLYLATIPRKPSHDPTDCLMWHASFLDWHETYWKRYIGAIVPSDVDETRLGAFTTDPQIAEWLHSDEHGHQPKPLYRGMAGPEHTFQVGRARCTYRDMGQAATTGHERNIDDPRALQVQHVGSANPTTNVPTHGKSSKQGVGDYFDDIMHELMPPAMPIWTDAL
ncbi:hypothetical protein BKA93DRAFT_753769 [Sparassis latifolia]